MGNPPCCRVSEVNIISIITTLRVGPLSMKLKYWTSLFQLKSPSWTRGYYLSVAGEGGVVKQEVSTKEHHNGVIHAQDGPIYEGGPPQQRVLSDVSAWMKITVGKDRNETAGDFCRESMPTNL